MLPATPPLFSRKRRTAAAALDAYNAYQQREGDPSLVIHRQESKCNSSNDDDEFLVERKSSFEPPSPVAAVAGASAAASGAADPKQGGRSVRRKVDRTAQEPLRNETPAQTAARIRIETDRIWCEGVKRSTEAAAIVEKNLDELASKIKNDFRLNNGSSARRPGVMPVAEDVIEQAKQEEVKLFYQDDAAGVLARKQRAVQAECGLDAELEQLILTTAKEAKVQDRQQNVYSRRSIACDRLRDASNSKGWVRFRAILARLDNLGFTRSSLQKLLHKHFIQAILPLYVAHSKHELTNQDSLCAFCFAHRF
jgi:hypothetical protein